MGRGLGASTSVAALVPQHGKTDELVGTRGVEQIAAEQAKAKRTRGELKRATRRAVAALVEADRNTVSLRHIHPGWLREAVRVRLDAGQTVTSDMIACMRAEGPDHG